MEWLKKNKKIKIAAIIILELLFLFWKWNHNYEKDLFYQNIPANEMIIVNQDCGVSYVDNNIIIYSSDQERWEEGKIFACGPYMPLKKGSYDITFQYITDTDGNSYKMYCGESRYLDALYAKDKDGFFPASENTLKSQIRVLKDIEAFDIQMTNYGTGSFVLQSVTIQQTNQDVKYYLIGWIIQLLIINVLLLNYSKLKLLFSDKNYKYTISLIALTIFSSILIFVNGFYSGHDIGFHFLRIEGLKEAILSGQFPAKIHPTHMMGYGYATGTMYPELLLYFPAILRILGVDSICAYKLFTLFVNALTVGIAFYSLKGIFKDRAIAFMGTVLYTLAPYRIFDLYYRAAVGEYCTIIGLPLIAYGLYTFIASKDDSEVKPKWIALAIGYSFVIESHILSTLFVLAFSVLIGLICLNQFMKKENLWALLKAFITFMLLNLWFIVPFIDYYRLPFNTFQDTICKNGVAFAQLFTNQILNDFPMHSQELELGFKGEMPYAIGYGILISVLAFVVFIREERENKKLGIISFAIGSLCIIFSLYQFPWDSINANSFLGKVVSNIQFPWRFLEITMISFVICGCVGVNYLSHKMNKYAVILIISIVAIIGYTNMIDPYIEKKEMNTYITLDTTDLGLVNEYMLTGTPKDLLIQNGEKITASSELVTYQNYLKAGTNIRIEINSESDTEQFIDLPLLMYPGYIAQNVDTKEKFAVTYSDHNTVRVMIPSHYQGSMKISFAGKWYWKVATWISILSVIVLLMYYVEIRKKQQKVERE